MNKSSNENRRVPGFTAETALVQGASTPYVGLTGSGVRGGAVEPALTFYYHCVGIQSLPNGGVHYRCSLYAIVE